MNLAKGGKVIALLVAEDEAQSVLTATENGYGKRTPIAEYTRHGRGTLGMIAIQTSEQATARWWPRPSRRSDDEIMLITSGGVLIRTRVNEVREMGRSTQGVTLINLGEGEKLSGLQTVVDRDEEEGGNGNGNGNGRQRQRQRGRAGARLRRRAARGKGTRDAHLEFRLRAGDAGARGPRAGEGGAPRLARQGHVRDGDEPPRQGVRRHRRRGRGGPAHAPRDPRQLQGAVPAGRRHRAVRGRAHEPAARQGRGRFRHHRRVVEEGASRRRRSTAARTSPPRPRTATSPTCRSRRRGSSRRTRPTCTSAPTRPSAAWSTTGRRTRATCRSSPTCPRTSCRARWTCRATGSSTPGRRRTSARPGW